MMRCAPTRRSPRSRRTPPAAFVGGKAHGPVDGNPANAPAEWSVRCNSEAPRLQAMGKLK
jgi:hypothetical protein